MSDEVTETFIYDTANEQTVIRAAIADAKTRKTLVRTLSPSEFLVPQHGPIWKALLDLVNRNLDFDPATFLDILNHSGIRKDDVPYVEELITSARLPKNLPYHVETMGWDATRARALKGPIPELLEAVRDPKAPAQEVIASARSVARALESKSGRRHALRPGEYKRAYMTELRARRERRNLYPLGAEAFDENLTEGFMPGNTAIMAGLPGAGKSAVSLSWCVMLAMMGRRPMYCAWEMKTDAATDVLCSQILNIELKRIVQGTLADGEMIRVAKCVDWISRHIKFMKNPFFDELRKSKKRPSNDRNLDILEGYIADSGCDVFVYDLWHRCLFWTQPNDVALALARMQNIHEEYDVFGLILHQLNLKDVEKRADKRPTRDAIKGTGAYVEVADLIFGVHRDAQFKSVPDTTLETICLKQRMGKANWCVRWQWEGTQCRISDPEEVAFNPGLESSGELGDIGDISDIKVKKTGKSKKQRRARQS